MSSMEGLENKRIVMCACHDVGLDMIEDLLTAGLPIKHIVSLSEAQARAACVSGYASFESVARRHGIPVHYPQSYALTQDQDMAFFRREKFDLLILGGWQRLIPEAILNTLNHGGLGVHGSSEFLPKGRGRSPINWSLIEGKTRFILHLFVMKSGVDDGDVLDHEIFDINPWDDCRTLYYKNALLTKRMLIRNIPQILSGDVKGVPQTGEPTYYPKRTPEDGRIDWAWEVFRIYDFVRAQTRPYPGAFSELDGERVHFWRAQPFDTRIAFPDAVAGEVVERFANGDFVVKCHGGLLLVTEASCRSQRGQVFSNGKRP